MRVSLFNYHLPERSIAQKPLHKRDHSRLLVYDRKKKAVFHRHFYDLPEFLHSGDLLVFNDTKVFPARLHARKPTGGAVEVFLLRVIHRNLWEVLIGGKRLRIGMKLEFANGLTALVRERKQEVWHLQFNMQGKALMRIVDGIGETPTPPYIKTKARLGTYQTVYAKKTGSVAAPTAGLHFTKSLLAHLKKSGVKTASITLHVGLGTFAPVKEKHVEDHRVHSEFAFVDEKTMKVLRKAKREKRRIIAVGTTTVRTLETVFSKKSPQQFAGWINTFIYPGHSFRVVDGMITNFHLPKSSLLMLVSAFTGRSTILKLYNQAIKGKYRFYSFGDAMLLF